ncbi:MAG TPA: CbiX/SirB N-terminal domain-containing protein [Bryobacteraceae bacterium]|nr:CbiX/SirB N-terminal domain-containing protein [Bryobacteraceae bacterium]
MTGYIVFAHGSSVESANDAVRAVARELAERGQFELVAAAFLEGGEPNLNDAARELAARGARRLRVVPYFLTLGLHLQRDLPKLIAQARLAVPGIEIESTAPLDGHPAVVDALLDRARSDSACGPN